MPDATRCPRPRPLHVAVAAALAALLAVPLVAPAQAEPTEQIVLDFCLANPDRCALSVVHLTGGWERHYNADRPQVTASTFKIFMLLAYADAVSRGAIDPDTVITREQWGRLWAGFDGGSLANAYARLGEPEMVSLDQLAGAMIRESDNATPDLLTDLLGGKAVERSIKRWVPGFHDVPKPINALFATFDNNPDDPAIGLRVIEDYAGIESIGYRNEVDEAFRNLHDPLYTQQIRLARCQFPPWEMVPPSCTPDFHNPASVWRELNNRFFTRATTRSYAHVMRGVLEGSLFPRRMQEVVERHLEFRMDFPYYQASFNRYGAKGGSLFPQGVLNWAVFMEAASGDRVVISIQLRRVSGNFGLLPAFAEAVALNPAFAEQVRDSLPADPELPELNLWLTSVDTAPRGKGKALDVAVELRNTSPFPVHAPSEVHLYLSDDNQWDASDELVASVRTPALPAYGTRRLRLKQAGRGSIEGTFVIVVADATQAVAEGDEDNNVAWERVGS